MTTAIPAAICSYDYGVFEQSNFLWLRMIYVLQGVMIKHLSTTNVIK
jgi:hypothetical protein